MQTKAHIFYEKYIKKALPLKSITFKSNDYGLWKILQN